MDKQVSVNGGAILALGIVGIVLVFLISFIGLICGLVAWSMGDSALKKLDATGITSSQERDLAATGRTCGAIAALLFLGGLLLQLAR